MAEPFKERFNLDWAAALADRAAALAPFDRARFLATVDGPLRTAELKARVAAVADGLFAAFGLPFPALWPHLVTLAGPEGDPQRPGAASFEAWPLLTIVERHGLRDPSDALDAMYLLTRRFSAEFAVRPFLAHHPQPTWARVRAWAADPSAHVRRLASEGTRPRLPWGAGVPALILDPEPGLAVISTLRADPVENVRDSVANHLNDVARDHPAKVLALLTAWADEPGPGRGRLIRKAARGLVKAGDPQALRLVGGGTGAQARAALAGPASVIMGGTLAVQATLYAEEPGRAVVDWVLRLPGARGDRTRVFKGAILALEPEAPASLTFRLRMVPRSTRALEPGPVTVGIQVDGVERGTFTTRLLPAGEADPHP